MQASRRSVATLIMALSSAACSSACPKPLIGNRSGVVVLLDYSKTFAPYNEQDVSALQQMSASLEGLIEIGQLQQPTKILWAAFGNDGLSPVRPCGPARVFEHKLVKTSSGQAVPGAIQDMKELQGWLIACVKVVQATSNDAQQFTDIPGALSFASSSNADVADARIVIIYTDLREDLPPGHQPATFDLHATKVLILSRPGLDDAAQPVAVLDRVAAWSKRLKTAGATRVCHAASQTATKNDIVSCLAR